ncbi:728_t:CDS:2 [Ambispora gerdemannii]|uniref:728_t:CDS:1 n=1 Tax=Ambispora gerdemannii TaxID=144530 RepID=A0A9N9AXS7_9GLOM|nr:728_t:CDS:2 [Ambispora gerdemannii]
MHNGISSFSSSQTKIEHERTAEIVRKTEEVIRAYREAGHALRYVSQVVGELQKILPEDMCIRLPTGLLNGPPSTELHLPDEIRKNDLLRKFKKSSTAANINTAANSNPTPPPNYGEFIMDIDPKPQKFRPIAPTIITNSSINAIIHHDNSSDRKSSSKEILPHKSFESTIKFPECVKEEEEQEDELLPRKPLSSNGHSHHRRRSLKSSKKIKSSSKSKNRHQPYERLSASSTDDESSEIPKEFFAMKMNFNSDKSSIMSTHSRMEKYQKSRRKKEKRPKKQQQIARHSPPSDDEAFDSTSPGTTTSNNSIIKKPTTTPNPLTAEQHALVDDFLKCLEPRLASGTVSQKGIALEIRQVSGNTSQIVQGTISKLIRKIAVPKDSATIAAIRAWIETEQAKNESSN